MHIPKTVGKILDTLHTSGEQAYLVGGCVRDMLLKRTPKDYDIATSATPDKVLALFTRAIPTGVKYGTVAVPTRVGLVEVTTFRSDGAYTDGRRPDTVVFGTTLVEDLARRDFTINAMAYDGVSLVDPFGGQEDLQDGIISCVGVPEERFREDALRMLRAVRLCVTRNFWLDAAVYVAVTTCAPLLANVSSERIRDEFNQIIQYGKGDVLGLHLLSLSGLLTQFLPELVACHGFDQKNPHHRKNVFWHTMSVFTHTPPRLELRLAALLHDIAKPTTFTLDANGVGHFYGHEDVGAVMADAILQRMKYSNEVREKVVLLVREHMFSDNMGKKAMRRFVVRLGEDNVRDLILFRKADVLGSGVPHNMEYLDELEATMEEMRLAHVIDPAASLAINGHDVMQALGIGPGPQVGRILTNLREAILDDPELNERGKLLQTLEGL